MLRYDKGNLVGSGLYRRVAVGSGLGLVGRRPRVSHFEIRRAALGTLDVGLFY